MVDNISEKSRCGATATGQEEIDGTTVKESVATAGGNIHIDSHWYIEGCEIRRKLIFHVIMNSIGLIVAIDFG